MNDEMKKMNHSDEDQEILQLLDMLSQLPEAPVPDEFDLRLRRALKEENAKRGTKSVTAKTSVWKKWTAAAACLMVGFLSFQMIQGGGVSFDMMSGGAEAAEEIGGESGPVAVLDSEIKKSTSDGGQEAVQSVDGMNGEVEAGDGEPGHEGYSLVQDDPILISDIQDEDSADLYGMNMESHLEANVGIDGEVIQMSRGQNPSKERELFAEDCEQIMTWIAEGIVEDDGAKLAMAMNHKNELGYTEEEAELTLKLYRDLLSEENDEMSWKCISLTGWVRSNIYRLTDGIRDLVVVITDTPEGLKVTEPILEKTQWLYEQIGEQDFTLMEMICHPTGEEIEFQVKLGKKNKELRNFVWKETESL